MKREQAILEGLIRCAREMTAERDRVRLIQQILSAGKEIAHCQAATLFLRTANDTLRFAVRTSVDDIGGFEVPLYDPVTKEPESGYVSAYAVLNNTTVVIDDVYRETRFDLSGTKRFSESTGLRAVSMLTVPLTPRDHAPIGVLQFLNATDPDTAEIVGFSPDVVGFVEALASQAAIALDNLRLVDEQRAMVDGLVAVMAEAVDAKSRYTGGHCARMSELAVMLAEAANGATSGALADFGFRSDEEWREFRIAARLHDFGKLATPEYIVDKATKLETVHNRIHEVRTRFEVLFRDAEIARLRAIHEQGVAPEQADAEFDERKRTLIDEFSFIAECNLGLIPMDADRLARLHAIASRCWHRNFDDRLGLSRNELRRMEQAGEGSATGDEPLLADKMQHVIGRDATPNPAAQSSFSMPIPEHQLNSGELYNLGIRIGTLTEEERFTVKEHVIHTIRALDNLPFPEGLRRIPEYAGCHHETPTGTGYPRQLSGDEVSTPARILAIADIFEALTAWDRPYTRPNTLSEAVDALFSLKENGEVDAELFDIFLRNGIYRIYGQRYLQPSQLDEVDISKYL